MTLKTTDRNIPLAIPLATCGCFLLLALATYHPFDPSTFASSLPEQKVENFAGKSGASLAASLFFYFGVMSFFLVLPFFWYSYHFFTGKKPASLIKQVSGWLFSFLGLLSVMPLIATHLTFKSITFQTGGDYGNAFYATMQEHFGEGGHLLIVGCILLMCVPSWGFLRPLWGYFADKKISFLKFTFRKNQQLHAQHAAHAAHEPHEPHELHAQHALLETIEPKVIPEIYPSNEEEQNKDHPASDCRPHSEKNPYHLPRPTAFAGDQKVPISDQELAKHKLTAEKLEASFKDFSVIGKVVGFKPGPVVTVFEFKARAGTKLSKISGLVDDIALALKVDSIFIHPVPGKDLVGIQVPNDAPETVLFGEIVRCKTFQEMASPLTFAIGRNLSGTPVCEELEKMPHLLMAGQTGSGKSVAINSLICSILMKSTPNEVRFILVDPKILELKIYEDIPHLLMPVITEPDRASTALKWATSEMDRRYQLMEKAHVRHILGFNKFWKAKTTEEKIEFQSQLGLDSETPIEPLPYIVLVIDELADLMLTAPKDVENSIQRLAQKARACGIHLVLATQRPSVDVITGVIKANLPSRIAFKVFSRGDSRTILDSNGADRLLGRGDMLYLKPGKARLERIQGAFLTDEEVMDFITSIKKDSKANYDESAMAWIDRETQKDGDKPQKGESFSLDPKWDEALHIAQTQGQISASFLQRQLKIGYNRAARVVEDMEREGLIGKADGAKPRKWIGSS